MTPGLRFEADPAAQHKIERGDVLVQVGEREFEFLASLQIEQFPLLEIADQDMARLQGWVDSLDIIKRLAPRLAQIEPAALLLDQQSAGPEQIDKAMPVIEQFYALLVNRHLPAVDPENLLEEIVVKGLGLALFVMRVFPVFTERFGAPFDFVPAQPHAAGYLRSTVTWQGSAEIFLHPPHLLTSPGPCHPPIPHPAPSRAAAAAPRAALARV